MKWWDLLGTIRVVELVLTSEMPMKVLRTPTGNLRGDPSRILSVISTKSWNPCHPSDASWCWPKPDTMLLSAQLNRHVKITLSTVATLIHSWCLRPFSTKESQQSFTFRTFGLCSRCWHGGCRSRRKRVSLMEISHDLCNLIWIERLTRSVFDICYVAKQELAADHLTRVFRLLPPSANLSKLFP